MKSLRLLALALIVVLAALAAKLYEMHVADQASLAAANASLAAAEKSAQAASAQAKTLRAELAQYEAQAPAATNTAAAPAPKKNPMAQIAEMMKNPAMRDMMAAQQKRMVQIKYGDLFKHYNLSADEQAQFVALLVDKEAPMMDLGLQAMSGNLTPDQRAALTKQAKDAQAAGEDKIRAFINNDDDFAYYQNYTKLQPYRSQVETLNTSLTKAGVPLDPTQADSLASLMYQTTKSFPADSARSEGADPAAALSDKNLQTSMDRESQIQNQVLQQAASFLSPDQLEALRASQAQQLQLNRQSAQMARSMFGTSGGQ